jgi:CheY-like chemotaxis protein
MKNVLLVDDDKIFNFLSEKTLQRMGAVNEIHSALNGKEAIDLLNDYFQGSRAMPDIIFLDLNMPIMDGFGFIEAFRKLNIPNKEKVRIVIVTSSQDPKDMERARGMGIQHYLTKPITEEKLRTALEMTTVH